MSARLPLDNKRILITRASALSAQLESKLKQLGAICVCLPLFDIKPVTAQPAHTLQAYDGLIYTSRNAVIHGPGLSPPLPQCLAVGPGTASELHERGVSGVLFPEDSRSEGLLSLPALANPADKRWLIIKGRGGRAHIAETLSRQGAHIEELVVYERRPISHDSTLIQQYLADIDYLLFFSGEGLQRLVELCPDGLRKHLLATQLVVPSLRVVKMAQDIGFRHSPCPANRMTDDAMIAATIKLAGIKERVQP